MKKRITSLLLVAAMLASMVILPVSAEGAEGAKTPGTYAAREVCPHCSEAIGDIPWTDLAGGEVSSAVNLTADGHYRLTGDLTVTNGHGINLPNGTSTSKPNVVLDLNGHSITASKRAIMVGKYNTFTVMDTVGGSTVKGLTATMGGTAVYAYDYTTVNMYDITANASDSTTGSGGAIYVSTSATFNMYSGVVNGTVNTASNKMGGTVYVNGATFNLYDGTVNTGSVPNGNGDCMYAAGTSTLNFRGGTVNGEVTVTTTSTVNLSGTPVLDNLDLSSGVLATVGELTSGASVAVTADAGTAFTQEFADATTAESYKSFIKPAPNYRTVEVTASNALALSEIICPHCGKTESQLTAEGDAWQAWDSATATGSTNPVTLSGHYYLTGDISHSGAYFVGVNTAGAQVSPDLAIDLRGYSLVSTNNRVAYVRKGTGETVLSFMDSVGGGELKGKYTSATTTAPGGVFYNEATLQFWDVKVTDYATTRTGVGGAINTSGNLNIVRSTVSGVAATSGGAIGTSGAAKVTIKDSTINGGTCTGDGGAIYSTTGSITIENSTVVDGTATHGGSIYFTGAGSLRVTDSTIGEVGAAAALNTLKLSGKTTISSLDLTNGSVADASDLTAGSAVTVIAADNTPFTTDLATPEDFVSYFSSGVADRNVAVSGNALVLREQAFVAPCYCDLHNGADAEWIPLEVPADNKITASGHYYLTESLTDRTTHIRIGAGNGDSFEKIDVVINLNGNDIISTKRALYIYGPASGSDVEGSTLLVMDHKNTGSVKGGIDGAGGVVYLEPNASLKMVNVKVVDTATTTRTGNGGAIYGSNGNVVLNNCQVSGNTTGNGGAIYMSTGSITVENNTVVNGTATLGDSIYIYSTGRLSVTDSTIGEVYAAGILRELTLSGNTTISSLDLTNGSVADASGLTAGSAVTVIAATGTPFTTDLTAPEDYVSYFSSGVDGKIVTVVGSALALAAPPAEPLTYYCPHCYQDVEWKPWTAEGGVKITASGHYYLEESASIGSQCYAGSSNDDTDKNAVNVILDLHGKSITSTVRVFQVYPYSTLTLLDTVGNSELSGKGANNDHGGVIVLRPNANLRILSGTYTANPKTTLRSGGVIYAGENSTIEVTGGTLDASAYDNASYFGGAIYTNIGSTVTLRDCKIIGGKAKQGGSVYTTGTDLIISGTTKVTGGTAENGGNIYCTYSAAKEKGSLLISDSAEISGGQAVNGGNVFAPSGAAVTMTGGTVKDGIAAYSAESALESQGRGGNLYLGGGAHSITGGTVTGGTSAADNAMFGGGNIYLLSGGSLELSGTAVVSNGESSTSGGDIFIGGVSTAKGTLSIASTVSGTLNIGTEDGKSLYGQTFPNATCESTDVVFKLDGNCGNAAITRQDDNTLVVAGGGLVLVGTDGKAQFYGDPAAAVSAYTGGYMLVAGADEVALSGGSYVIDLNGYSNVAVTGTGTMLGFDSNNAASGYQTSAQVMVDPAVTVSNTLVTTAPDGRQYVKVQDGNTYSFHAFDLSVKSVSIAPNADSSSMYYKGVWNGDDILKNNAIQSFGIVVSVKDLPGDDFRTEVEGTIDGEPANYNRYSEFTSTDFANGVVKTGVEITEIMKTDLTNEANAYRGSQIKIYAAAYYTFSDGTETVTVTVPVVNDGYSLYDVMNLIDNNDTAYNALQAKIDPFYTTWQASMDLWFTGYTYNETAYERFIDTFTNIKAVTTPAEV